MKSKIDLHIHSTYSDGSYDPKDLVKKYKDVGFSKISITDHDGIGGQREAIEHGKKLGIEVVPGIEFSTSYDGHECHLLGYGFDLDDKELNSKLEEIWAYRVERNKILLAKLKEKGYDIELDELMSESKGGYVGKPNIARLMTKHGYIRKPKDAFIPGKYLEAPDIKEIKRNRITTEEAIRLIVNAGGQAVLAHPVKLKWFGKTDNKEYWDSLEEMIIRLKKEGLSGMECYYPEHSKENIKKYIELADKYELEKTEGSDFHGEDLE